MRDLSVPRGRWVFAPGTTGGSPHQQQEQAPPTRTSTSTVRPGRTVFDGLASRPQAQVPAIAQSWPEGQAFHGSAFVLHGQGSGADVLPHHGIVQTALHGRHAIGPDAAQPESHEAQTQRLLTIFNKRCKLADSTKDLYVCSTQKFFEWMDVFHNAVMPVNFVHEISGSEIRSIESNSYVVDYLKYDHPYTLHLCRALRQMWMALSAEESEAQAQASVITQPPQPTHSVEPLSPLTPKQEANARLLGSKLEPQLNSTNAAHGTIFSDVIARILSSDFGHVQGPMEHKGNIAYRFEGVQTSSGLLVDARLVIAPDFMKARLAVDIPHVQPQATYECLCDISPA